MKPLKDMTQAELIELVAATSLRVIGFTFVIAAIRGSITGALVSYSISQLPSSIHSPYASSGHLALYASACEQVVIDTVIATVCFALTVPLTRLITRGLAKALEPKSYLP